MVEVRYFSILREKLGKDSETLPFEGSVRELKEKLKERYPNAEKLIDAVRVAVNEEYVNDDYKISQGDRVALIPPVSGG
ncbi:MAG: molybdopterin converting factor subunit 1 [Aquificae bacterium]|nr:molybdopterin converting factor subunit 1 [Aquificota bacterium]